MTDHELGEAIAAELMRSDPETYIALMSPRGLADQTRWRCEDGWVVGYTTSRIEGGPDDGRFAAMAYKPIGTGSRSGKASEWRLTYWRAFAKRKTARARAEQLFYRHSPRLAARRGIEVR